MKYISRNQINLGFGLIVLSGLMLGLGMINWTLLIFAGICIVAYIILDKNKLRCPHCKGFENLERLMYAKNHVYYCRHCGKRLVIM
jgi:late competence protein required for DNA uptake (superfamily II DNA/RNA helicase)